MVLFLNLDSSKPPPHNNPHNDLDCQSIRALHWQTPLAREPRAINPPANPNTAHPFTALLSSYPLLISLVKHLDLNDLATLSSTCHPFRSLLLPQRENLISTSLACKNSGQKFRRCVKDLVNECRGCLEPICRNCARRPNAWVLSLRLRRLCSNHRVCSLQEFGRFCDCAEIWLCPGCLGRYSSLEPKFVKAMKLISGKRECPLGKREGYVGCNGDGGGDCATGSGSVAGEGEVLEFPLKLERTGVFRGWCDWCDGVVLTVEDRAALEKAG
ncbi:hypothetical protein L873DRAFT_1106149 [Choiromyces venosus 120613-1]|uniref:F-box domain-containing protein n=1 Tax=Choiromyces venosus 120613-1 TaxID=1336337 RepID=A0A3N4JHH8_9PEZI|nr:hypothetical protein L873DRAFT_1106149 [Choiromyces venosus 120613-1]